MSSFKNEPLKRVKFFLYNDSFREEIDVPDGYDENQPEYARHSDFLGIIPMVSSSLTYSGKAKVIIDEQYDKFGVNADVKIVKYEYFYNKYDFVYSGKLDFSEISIKHQTTSIPLNSYGLVNDIKNNKNKIIEIKEQENLIGEKLLDIEKHNILLKGVDIPRSTEWDNNNALDNDNNSVSISSGSWDKETFWWLTTFNISKNDDIDNLNDLGFISQDVDNNYSRVKLNDLIDTGFFTTDKAFLKADNFTGDIQISTSGTINLNIDNYNRVKGNPGFKCLLIRTGFDDLDYIVKDEDIIFEKTETNVKNLTGDYDVFFSKEYENVTNNDYFYIITIFDCYLRDTSLGANANISFTQKLLNFSMKGFTTDTVPSTECKGFRLSDLLKYVLHYISNTNNTIQSSKFNKDQEFYNHFISSGLQIRGGELDGNISSEDGFKYPQISMSDIIESINASHGLSVGIESNSENYKLVIEDFDYFFDKSSFIDIGEVYDLETKTSKDDLFNSIEFGYEKSDDIDGMEALKEFNTKSRFSLNVNVSSEKKLTKLSKFITSMYAIEYVRMDQITDDNKSSLTNDNDLFMFDCTKITVPPLYKTFYTPKTFNWGGFQNKIKGISDTETTFNFTFSPMNMIYRYSSLLQAAVVKQVNPILKFLSSDRNNTLVTSINDKSSELKEGKDNSFLKMKEPLIEADMYYFKKNLTPNIRKIILGKDKNNKPNFYKLIKFSHKGFTGYGFLYNLKPSSEDWVLKKAYYETKL